MLHLTKLSVGTRDLVHLRALQAVRAEADPPLRHRTRSFPKRAAEILQGGSIYWVVAGAVQARQRLRDIVEETRGDGTRGTLFLLEPELVAVVPRLCKPFQGWRYLPGEDVPADLDLARQAHGVEALPEALRRDLMLLCLL